MNVSQLRLAFLSLITAALAGCAVGNVTPEERRNADYGTEISQVRAVELAEAWLDKKLKISESARKVWGCVHPSNFHRTFRFRGTRIRFGWFLRGEINAQNRKGEYTGCSIYYFQFFNGELVKAWANVQEERSCRAGTPSDANVYPDCLPSELSELSEPFEHLEYPAETEPEELARIMSDPARWAPTIRLMQISLQIEGLYEGPADGVLNRATKAGLLEFKRRRGIPGNTIMDRETLDALAVTEY